MSVVEMSSDQYIPLLFYHLGVVISAIILLFKREGGVVLDLSVLKQVSTNI